ncbi:hypothetical protein [Ferroplasma sp.]|uniref:hypothetical protein n=1 Tax=Ferroplasma sp. TaxID=2591003 RepID=UPI0026150546|nr:hypothetical protein [Ferroplasma sp.]
MTFDYSGMLVIPKSLIQSWKLEVNHKKTYNNWGYSPVSGARYHITRTSSKCEEAI